MFVCVRVSVWPTRPLCVCWFIRLLPLRGAGRSLCCHIQMSHSHVASSHTHAEASHIDQYVSHAYWLGSNGTNQQGAYRWSVGPSSGSSIPTTYWGSGQPTVSVSGGARLCVAAHNTNTTIDGWFTEDCSLKQAYLVQYRCTQSTILFTGVIDGEFVSDLNYGLD
jgi:hypothetical protein